MMLAMAVVILGIALYARADFGTLDTPLLAARIRPEPAALTAAALMTTGLLAKTAFVPLHLWLPPAHAAAPAAVSTALSGLVIKSSWFLLVRLWIDVLPAVVTQPSAQLRGLGREAVRLSAPMSRLAETAALALALCSLLLGSAAAGTGGLVRRLDERVQTAELWSAVLLIGGGAAVAIGLAPQLPTLSVGKTVVAIGRPVRGATVSVGAIFVRADGALQRWSVVGLWLVSLALAFDAALFATG